MGIVWDEGSRFGLKVLGFEAEVPDLVFGVQNVWFQI